MYAWTYVLSVDPEESHAQIGARQDEIHERPDRRPDECRRGHRSPRKASRSRISSDLRLPVTRSVAPREIGFPILHWRSYQPLTDVPASYDPADPGTEGRSAESQAADLFLTTQGAPIALGTLSPAIQRLHLFL